MINREVFNLSSWLNRRFSNRLEKYFVLDEDEDSDVTKERQKMASSANEDLRSKYIMKITNLTRVFRTGVLRRKKKLAVKSISVGIKKGEVSTKV